MQNKFLSNKQSGFRKSRCFSTSIIKVVEDIRRFDKVNHEILLTKLRVLYNFSETALRLMHSYVNNRQQAVVVNSVKSNHVSIKRGIPQGSVLGPLLFSIYINDLPTMLSNCDVHMYTDDVQLYVSRPLT